ncbi:MAG: isoprenyl transferase [Caldicoprobacter oshimai]|uniref:Isoprenyl transferase n=1 Tax=Caldicoprobacter faecalis TaxID=937334 RepID=A0A1I5RRF0_9FIRM|nr:isoprenyl transferase [Caldicoprobacter faecalis]PZN10841.1 MAG: isoprenyl transferase [Caldicoprobacter oshimai]SFP60506.1 Undecaprenyl pyrophosphate synthetase [Caldicoprobacter faecalis]
MFTSKRNTNEADLSALMEQVKSKPLPQHVAIIMDGNGRWATKRGLPRVAGHRQGVEALREVIKTSDELGIKYLTLYAFSTENWKRPASEIDALMSLLVEYLRREIRELNSNNVKISVLGQVEAFPTVAQREIAKAVELTKNNTGLNVNIALNYGGRAEIVRAAKAIARDVLDKKISIDDIDERLFSSYLYTANIPDPDLLIRTSGEFRLSNFLLYQVAYTELVFTAPDVLWPDFDKKAYLEAIMEYQGRQRRYGGLDV